MTEQKFTDTDDVVKSDQGANDPVINPDAFTDESPVDGVIIDETPAGVVVTEEARSSTEAEPLTTLLDQGVSEHLRRRWNEIQGKFVDDPRAAVQQADELVSDAVENIARMFASERSSLEGQWSQGMDVSTEDLRKTLQHYRAFFNRLVA
jgi:hypothetical protein